MLENWFGYHKLLVIYKPFIYEYASLLYTSDSQQLN